MRRAVDVIYLRPCKTGETGDTCRLLDSKLEKKMKMKIKSNSKIEQLSSKSTTTRTKTVIW